MTPRLEPTADRSDPGGLRIGALVRNTDFASNERVRRDYAWLSGALLGGAFEAVATRRLAFVAGLVADKKERWPAHQSIFADRDMQTFGSPFRCRLSPVTPASSVSIDRWPRLRGAVECSHPTGAICSIPVDAKTRRRSLTEIPLQDGGLPTTCNEVPRRLGLSKEPQPGAIWKGILGRRAHSVAPKDHGRVRIPLVLEHREQKRNIASHTQTVKQGREDMTMILASPEGDRRN